MGKEKKMGEKLKEGVSVQELETFARKYTTEVFIILAIIIATISGMFNFFTGAGWSIFFAGLGAILGISLFEKIEILQQKLFQFFRKQEKTTQIIIGVVRIIVALFLPFLIFAEMGLLAGISFHYLFRKAAPQPASPPEEKKED